MDISTHTLVGQVFHDPQVTTSIAGMIVSVLATVSTIVAAMLGKLIKTKLNAENSSWKQKLAFRLVCYAEQKLVDAGNAGKFDYVSKELQSHFGVDPHESEHLIEEAVATLRANQSSASPVSVNVTASIDPAASK